MYIWYQWLSPFNEKKSIKNGEILMKTIALLTLLLTIGCILASGCVAQTKKDPVNASVAPTSTFAPFNNSSVIPGANTTFNITNATNTSTLKGPLRVSIGSYPTDQALPVLIDNQTVGVVTVGVPIDLVLSEGNHTVAVCVGVICPAKPVNIIFAKSAFLDFEETLKEKAEFSKPTVRILKSYKRGEGVSVDVEFINPTQKDIVMSAEVICGYSYIDYRSSIRMGDSVRSKVSEWVEAGQRVTRTVDLYFAEGSSYSFDDPYIGEVTPK